MINHYIKHNQSDMNLSRKSSKKSNSNKKYKLETDIKSSEVSLFNKKKSSSKNKMKQSGNIYDLKIDSKLFGTPRDSYIYN